MGCSRLKMANKKIEPNQTIDNVNLIEKEMYAFFTAENGKTRISLNLAWDGMELRK